MSSSNPSKKDKPCSQLKLSSESAEQKMKQLDAVLLHAQDDFGLQLEVLASNRSNVVPLRSVATNERPSWLSQKMVNLPQGWEINETRWLGPIGQQIKSRDSQDFFS